MKDRHFWFGTRAVGLELDGTERPERSGSKPANSVRLPTRQSRQVNPARRPGSRFPPPSLPPQPFPSRRSTRPVTVRTVLPPLDVEVIAGDTHRTIHPGSNATKVELTHPVPARACFFRPQLHPTQPSASTSSAATQRPSLPAAGAAHERAGIGGIAGRDRRRRHYSGFTRAQRSRASWRRQPSRPCANGISNRSCRTVRRRNPSQDHRQLHHQDRRQYRNHPGREPLPTASKSSAVSYRFTQPLFVPRSSFLVPRYSLLVIR